MNKIFLGLITLLIILSSTIYQLEMSETASLIGAYLFTSVLGIFFHPLVQKIFYGRENSYPIAKAFSFLFFGYLIWFGQVILSINGNNIALFLALTVIGLFVILFKKINSWKEILFWETLSLSVFIIFLTLCSFKPELNWGEKPMDISLLNYLFRENGNINEPWFSGVPLKYYYYGHFILAKFLSIFKLHPHVGIYFCLAYISSLFFLLCTSVFSIFSLDKKNAVLGAIFITFSSSLQSIFGLLTHKNYDVSYYWSNTRVFADNLFAEFPFWSFSFADLHPHVIAYPISLFVIWLTVDMMKRREEKFIYFFIPSFVGVTLAVINSWDVIFLAPLNLLVVFIVYKEQVLKEKKWHILLYPIFGSLISIVLYLPLIKVISEAGQGGSFYIFKGNHNNFMNFFRHQGIALSILTLLLLINFDVSKIKLNLKKYLIPVFLLMVSVVLFFVGGNPSLSILMYSILISVLAVNQKELQLFPITIWVLLISVMMFFSEHFVLLDRINSIFKINNLIFVIGSLMAFTFYFHIPKNKILNRVILLVFSLGVGVSLVNGYAVSRYQVTHKDSHRLNGKDYLKTLSPGDNRLIDYINSNISGTPIIVESFGGAYDYKRGRIQWFTGLQSYLTWSGQHLNQRGIPFSALKLKEGVIKRIYNSTSLEEKYNLLKKEKIEFIVIGAIERKDFKNEGLNLFSNDSDRFHIVFEDDKTKTILYQVL